MGSWLVSGGNNLAQIGGPSVHLPIVRYVLFWWCYRYFLGFSLVQYANYLFYAQEIR